MLDNIFISCGKIKNEYINMVIVQNILTLFLKVLHIYIGINFKINNLFFFIYLKFNKYKNKI